MTTCINLREQFGREYRIGHDPAYFADYGARARVDDPWLQIIPGGRGHIYPHGGDLLAVATNGRGPIVAKLAAVPSVAVVQDGTDGINATFPLESFAEVAGLIQARRRRKRLSPEHRAKLVAAGAASRFQHGTKAREIEPESTIGTLDDSRAANLVSGVF